MKSTNYSELLQGIDRAIDAHLDWNQRLLRCALLHESPGDDVLLPDSHKLCQFGIWFDAQRTLLDKIDHHLIQRIDDSHRYMHDGVRALSHAILEHVPASNADLQLYQSQQTTMISLLHTLRQQIVNIDTHRDALTGLPNRHGLEHIFTIRRRDAIRNDLHLWLALADIDYFKAINDNYGHSVGDVAIKHAADRLSLCLRSNDILFRYGGEEFLALLLVESDANIDEVATRMLHSVHSPLVLADEQSLSLSVTIGLTRVSSDEKIRAAIDRADFALLDGKKAGRDRYIITNENHDVD